MKQLRTGLPAGRRRNSHLAPRGSASSRPSPRLPPLPPSLAVTRTRACLARSARREHQGGRNGGGARARAPPPLCPAAGSRPQPSRGFPLAASPPRPSSVRPGRGHGPEVSRARPRPFRVLCPSGRGLAAPPALAAVWPRAPASSKVTPRPHRLLPVVGPCERL